MPRPEQPVSDEYYDDFDFIQPSSSMSSSTSFTPQHIDSNTFKQRNDPQELLLRVKLQLMNAYIKEEKSVGKDGVERTIFRVKKKKGLPPKANKKGQEEIISYMERLINGHTVQANTIDMNHYRGVMRFISQDIVIHFVANRRSWGMTVDDCDELVGTIISFMDLFVTRTLYNEERKSYGESYKEETHREVKPEQRPNFLQRVGSFMSGNKGGGMNG